jgi:putative hydrolase of the HAD superfamily
MIEAVIWDFGGVILTSPFEAFARYERELGIPEGFIRSVNATNPDDNAWAKLERAEVDVVGFGRLFENEAKALSKDPAVAAISGPLSGCRVAAGLPYEQHQRRRQPQRRPASCPR